jgi:hypothetical protein
MKTAFQFNTIIITVLVYKKIHRSRETGRLKRFTAGYGQNKPTKSRPI